MYKKKKYRTAGQVTDDNTIRRMRCVCWTPKARYKQNKIIFCFADRASYVSITLAND